MKLETELRELDAWIAEHLFGAHIYKTGRGSIAAVFNMNRVNEPSEYNRIIDAQHPWDENSFNPTINPADAMSVLEKCLDRDGTIVIRRAFKAGGIEIVWLEGSDEIIGPSSDWPNLPLAIAKFARQLFSV